ncbi:hypothetical protein U9M48_041563 [Paspalum notatum var. saurae]|uniref:Uncharacterized protein n=1 Tax=Paspalum notatum var. saurae TaxID=547442 RepID=A0AAQ3UTF5_PASNO
MQLLQSLASSRTWFIHVRTCSSCSPPSAGTVRARYSRKLFMLSISSLMNCTSPRTPPSSAASLRMTPSSELTAPDASSAIDRPDLHRMLQFDAAILYVKQGCHMRSQDADVKTFSLQEREPTTSAKGIHCPALNTRRGRRSAASNSMTSRDVGNVTSYLQPPSAGAGTGTADTTPGHHPSLCRASTASCSANSVFSGSGGGGGRGRTFAAGACSSSGVPPPASVSSVS